MPPCLRSERLSKFWTEIDRDRHTRHYFTGKCKNSKGLSALIGILWCRISTVTRILGENIFDSSIAWCGDEWLGEPVSLCIAATCRSEGEPAIVVCCDKAGTRGDIKSDDIVKIRDVGSTVVLLAGDTGQAKALLAECRPVIEAFPVAGDDAEINKLLTSLPQAIKRRKRAIADDELAGEFGVTWDEVFNFSQAHPDDPRWADAWRKIRSLNLGAALIIGTFTDDEVAIVTVDMHGKIGWSDHYAAIGSGSAVAGAFLNQREYDDEMGVPECIYRVMEAKIAAERNPHVGRIMNLEVRTRNSNRFIQSIYHDKIRELIKVQRALPEIPDLSSIDFTEGILPVGGTSDAVSSGE